MNSNKRKTIYYYIIAIIGFIILDLHLNVLIAKSTNIVIQIGFVVLFFPILKILLKLTKLNNFTKIGISFHKNWNKNLLLGFGIGFIFWALKYLIEYTLNGFEIVGVKGFKESIFLLIFVILVFFIGSFLNDIILRGYVFGHLKGRIHAKWIFIISIFLYALEDSWNEGFSISNIIFSLLLGLSLTYVFFRTNSIWANTGIHWGLNVCYGLFNGMLGSTAGGIFIVKDNPNPSLMVELVGFIIPILMFWFVYLVKNKFYVQTNL